MPDLKDAKWRKTFSKKTDFGFQLAKPGEYKTQREKILRPFFPREAFD
jgi:hypothetical protein